jgi:hypothetical protein
VILADRIDLEIIWLLVIVLIGIVSAIRGFIQRRMIESRRAESGGKSPPPVSTQIRQEVLKYLGEIKPEKKPAAESDVLPVGHADPAAARRVLAPEPPPPPTVPEITFPKLEPTRKVVRRRVVRRLARPTTPARTPGRRLLTRENLRQAVLYREILGPPVAMRRMGRSISKLSRR